MATIAFRNAPNCYVTHRAHKTWTPFAFPASLFASYHPSPHTQTHDPTALNWFSLPWSFSLLALAQTLSFVWNPVPSPSSRPFACLVPALLLGLGPG